MNIDRRTNAQSQKLYGLLRSLDLMDQKDELVDLYTNGRTTRSREMTVRECSLLIEDLVIQERGVPDPEKEARGRMIHKVFATFYEINWDKARIYGWVKKHGHKTPKELKDYAHAELTVLVTQAERAVAHSLKQIRSQG